MLKISTISWFGVVQNYRLLYWEEMAERIKGEERMGKKGIESWKN